ncbi:MAG: CapA family protein [Candidatus Binatia bacterium]
MSDANVRLFLCGDVMTGRGIDQILPHPSEPTLHEPAVKDARGYVRLAEDAHGPIPRAVDFRYVWGDALAEMRERRPDVRFVVLETAVTRSEDWMPKGINYRMHPENVGVLTAAGIDGVTLANNHVLDWGPAGLLETLKTLRDAGVKTAGAGRNLAEAKAPAVFDLSGKARVLVHGFGSPTSGVPLDWSATDDLPGVNVLAELSEGTLRRVAADLRSSPRTIRVASIHWGPNWGYGITPEQRSFARGLVEAGVDVVHGHSSHHPKGIEVHRGRPILYGCGDFLNDYEGIGGYEEYRPDLSLMYFADLAAATGSLVELRMVPMQIERFRLRRASGEDAGWLRGTLSRLGEPLGTRVELEDGGTLRLRWHEQSGAG